MIGTRLKEIPAFILLEGTVGVGWFTDDAYFTFIIESYHKTGKCRKTFIPTRLTKTYASRGEAIKETCAWLGTSLI